MGRAALLRGLLSPPTRPPHLFCFTEIPNPQSLATRLFSQGQPCLRRPVLQDKNLSKRPLRVIMVHSAFLTFLKMRQPLCENELHLEESGILSLRSSLFLPNLLLPWILSHLHIRCVSFYVCLDRVLSYYTVQAGLELLISLPLFPLGVDRYIALHWP